MEQDLIEATNKKIKNRCDPHPEKPNSQAKEEKFNNRYSITERTKCYEALSDPYTSYYFSNRSVKDHLKRFKRAIREELNKTEKNRMNKLLTSRIKEKFQDYLSPKTLIYEKELTGMDLETLGNKSSASLSKKKSKLSLASHHTDLEGRNAGHSTKRQHFPKIETVISNTREKASALPETKQVIADQKLILKEVIDMPVVNEKIPTHTPRLAKHGHRKHRKETFNSQKVPESQKSEAKESRLKTTTKQKDKGVTGKKTEQLHIKKHEKWVQFLKEKKLMLTKLKYFESGNPEIAQSSVDKPK